MYNGINVLMHYYRGVIMFPSNYLLGSKHSAVRIGGQGARTHCTSVTAVTHCVPGWSAQGSVVA